MEKKMKRSEIYLKCALELQPHLKSKDALRCGCALLCDIGGIDYTGGKAQRDRIKKLAPEYYLFRPDAKWNGNSAFCTFETNSENTNWRYTAFMFAAAIAKSNGQ